ncbi:fumarylacetoacetate hydrolase family protein [Parafrankia sp. EUN1f]|uniref:fumarylacetoacetate hydrolase family protein n=1 Tax=Parafrankia sp. EUN1f TaxID=102897 RepID=UPI0001C44AEF|nr:fumarylacetoacetate hydrolase family protein [Parafrankia sp. EUN1f]EFC82923.1 5-carboxymethyl-2-hydroxymuconate Delta-isomerase [Parafrankia sp. EUN1f]
MRLSTVRRPGGETAAGRVEGDEIVLLPFASVGTLIASGPDWRQAAAVDGERIEREGADLAPLVPQPPKIVCMGLNYATHLKEMGRTPPTHPTLFAKYASSLIGAHDDIIVPPVTSEVDWEGELAFVIGSTVRFADEDSACAAIAGYTVMNDITMRDWQFRTLQFLQGKTFEGSTPLGPELVTPDELDNADDLALRTLVNGEVMQKSRTSDLLFPPATIVAYVSQFITLVPGDVLTTGTPGGVGHGRDPKVYLADGDVVTVAIDGIGTTQNTVRFS